MNYPPRLRGARVSRYVISELLKRMTLRRYVHSYRERHDVNPAASSSPIDRGRQPTDTCPVETGAASAEARYVFHTQRRSRACVHFLQNDRFEINEFKPDCDVPCSLQQNMDCHCLAYTNRQHLAPSFRRDRARKQTQSPEATTNRIRLEFKTQQTSQQLGLWEPGVACELLF